MPHQCTGCGHTFEDGSKEMLSGCPECGGNKFQFRPAGSLDPPDSRGDPGATASAPGSPDSTPPEPDRPDHGSSVAETVGRATTQLRDLVSSGPEPSAGDGSATSPSDGGITDPDPEAEWPNDWDPKSNEANDPGSSGHPKTGEEMAATGEDGEIIDADANRQAISADDRDEDLAQASARSDIVPPGELDGRADKTPTQEAPGNTTNRSTDKGVAGPASEEPDLAELREQLNDQFESIKILEPGQYELNLMELYDREEYIIALQENGRYVIQVPEQWIGDDIDDR